MDGLGYGLIEVGGVVNYNCNYKGYTFKYPAPLDEIAVVIDQVDQYESYDEEGNGIGNMTIVDVPRNIMKDENASGINIKERFSAVESKKPEYLNWCNKTFLEKEPALIEEVVKNDVDGNPAGKQWDFEENVFVYETEDTFKKRAVVWADDNLSEAQIDSVISTKGFEDIDALDKVGKIKQVIDKHGVDQGFYRKAKTAPCDKIVMEL